MGLISNLFSKKIEKIEKHDTLSGNELSSILKYPNGIKIIENGAQKGNLKCQQFLYTLFMIGEKASSENREKFEHYTKLAAFQDDSTAQANYAKIILDNIEELKSENIENNGILIDSLLDIQEKLNECLKWYKLSYANGNKKVLDNINNIEIHLLQNWINPLVDEYYQ